MNIWFNSDDDLPLNKLLRFHLITTIIRCVFREDGKLYPQLFLDDTLYELQKCYSTKELIIYITSEFNFYGKKQTKPLLAQLWVII